METVVLTIHLILALLLIGVVLIQKSEGAALLSGGGNMQARAKPTVLTRVTWILAIAFICTSILLTVLATRGTGSGSVIDGLLPPTGSESGTPSGADLLPPPASGAAPVEPPRADEPLTPPPAETAPAAGSEGSASGSTSN